MDCNASSIVHRLSSFSHCAERLAHGGNNLLCEAAKLLLKVAGGRPEDERIHAQVAVIAHYLFDPAIYRPYDNASASRVQPALILPEDRAGQVVGSPDGGWVAVCSFGGFVNGILQWRCFLRWYARRGDY